MHSPTLKETTNHNEDADIVVDDTGNRPPEIVLALDIGSSSIRCSAYSVQKGSVISLYKDCFAVRHASTVEPTSGKIRLSHASNGDEINLLDEIDSLVDECLSKLRLHATANARVVGLGFASFCMNLVALNGEGRPVGPAATLSYACASSAVAQECQYLKNHLGADREKELYQRTGTPIHSSYALAQLRELYNNPDSAHVVDQIVVWQTLSSTCLTKWRGTPFSHISYSEASWTGLFNYRACEWDKEALSLLPEACKNHMPPLADYHDNVMGGTVLRPEVVRDGAGAERNPYWDRWPELRPCRLLLGLGDGACANIGSKCTTDQKISVTIGTSAAVRVCLPSPSVPIPPDEGLFLYRLDRSHVLLGGALTDGGSVVSWARDLLGLQNEQEFLDCLQEVEQLLNQEYEQCLATDQESHLQQQQQPHDFASTPTPAATATAAATSAISLLPFLSGERSTGFRDSATFCISGLTRTSTRAHFLKACLEGVILRLEAILRLVRNNTQHHNHGGGGGGGCGTSHNEQHQQSSSSFRRQKQPRIVVSGTALERNGLWRQMLADCTGLLVQFDTQSIQTTSLGVAIMVATALQMERDMAADSTTHLHEIISVQQQQLLQQQQSAMHHGGGGESIYHSPRLPVTSSYWANALEDQENLIDVVSSLW